MISRKKFLVGSAAVAAAVLVPGAAALQSKTLKKGTMKKTNPKNAAVIWYSQTGHTERYAKYIARILKKKGLSVTAADYREFDVSVLRDVDLVIIGSPTFYMEAPKNFRMWIEKLAPLEGVAVASFSTFGGPGGNQFNTSFTLLELLSAKGAVPAGIAQFGNMSTFAPTWSMGNEKRILNYRHLPNQETYSRVSAFALSVLDTVKSGKGIEVAKEFSMSDCVKGGISIAGTKLFITNHHINKDICIGCETCVKKCPVGAVDLAQYTINTSKCVACIGCVNNCPTQAMTMSFLGKSVYGFNEFIKRNKIVIAEPADV